MIMLNSLPIYAEEVAEKKVRLTILNLYGQEDVGVGGEISRNKFQKRYYGKKQVTEDSSNFLRIAPVFVDVKDDCGYCDGVEYSYLVSIGDVTRSTVYDVDSILSFMTTLDGEFLSFQSNGVTEGTELMEMLYLGGVSIGTKDVRINAQVGAGGKFEIGQTKGPFEISAAGVASLDISDILRASAKKEYSISFTSGDKRKLDHLTIDFFPGKIIGNNVNNLYLGFELKKEQFSLFYDSEEFETSYGGLKAGIQF